MSVNLFEENYPILLITTCGHMIHNDCLLGVEPECAVSEFLGGCENANIIGGRTAQKEVALSAYTQEGGGAAWKGGGASWKEKGSFDFLLLPLSSCALDLVGGT